MSTEDELFKASGAKTGQVVDEALKDDCEYEAETAWAATKDSADPDWGLTPLTHRERLIYVAQSVKRTGYATTPFELVIAKLLQPPKAKAAAAEAPKAKAKPKGKKSDDDETVH